MKISWRMNLLAGSLFTLATAIPAIAAATNDAKECAAEPVAIDAPAADPGSLQALRPTLLIVAEDYDKKAAEFSQEAERYRTWASAEDMFGGATYGKRYAAIYFADEANALDKEAAESRRLATKYRKLANSPKASSGC